MKVWSVTQQRDGVWSGQGAEGGEHDTRPAVGAGEAGSLVERTQSAQTRDRHCLAETPLRLL
jgi:hypothetical protein